MQTFKWVVLAVLEGLLVLSPFLLLLGAFFPVSTERYEATYIRPIYWDAKSEEPTQMLLEVDGKQFTHSVNADRLIRLKAGDKVRIVRSRTFSGGTVSYLGD